MSWRIIRNMFGRVAASVLLAGIAVTGAATAATAASAQPAPAASVRPLLGGSFHEIRESGNGQCLEPQGLSTGSSTLIVEAPCALSGTESLAQGWQFTRVGTNHYTFLNQLSGLCLDVPRLANGGLVIQSDCTGISNQEFNTGTSLPAVAKIESRIHFSDSGFCVSGSSGFALVLPCTGNPAQIWVNGF